MRLTALLLGSFLLLVQGCATSSLKTSSWFEVKTEHFEIISQLSKQNTETLAHNAELFHSAAEFVMGTVLPAPAVPTRIIAFDGRGLLRPFAVRGARSYFQPTQRDTLIVFRTGGGWREDITPSVRHEYMHYLLENHGGFGEHLWFDEGFSQLMSSVDVRGNHVDIGFREDYVLMLRQEPWLPVLHILRSEDLENLGQRKRPLFHAQSWALIHFLYFGQDDADRGRKQLKRYFHEIEVGSSYQQAVERGFGLSIDALEKALHKYIRQERFDTIGVRFADSGDRVIDVRRLPRHEALTRLGWLLLAIDREDQAQDWFESALELEPGDTRALAGLGSAADRRGEWDEALPRYQRAVELEPNDALNRLDLGLHYYRHAQATEDPRARMRLLEQARSQLQQSSKLDASLPEPYAAYGETYLLAGQEPAEALPSMERAHRLAPYDQRLELRLARMYFALDRPGLARKLVLEAHANTHSKSLRVEAEELLQEIDAAAGSS